MSEEIWDMESAQKNLFQLLCVQWYSEWNKPVFSFCEYESRSFLFLANDTVR